MRNILPFPDGHVDREVTVVSKGIIDADTKGKTIRVVMPKEHEILEIRDTIIEEIKRQNAECN